MGVAYKYNRPQERLCATVDAECYKVCSCLALSNSCPFYSFTISILHVRSLSDACHVVSTVPHFPMRLSEGDAFSC
jgi:hypothetical protein